MISISIGFHDVEDSDRLSSTDERACPSLYTLNREAFRAHLCAIAKNGARNNISRVSQDAVGADMPIYLTFDDGASGAYTCVAEELEAMNWRGHFFIATSWIGRTGFMTAAQIRELDERGHVIGSHTHTHPARMSSLSWEDLTAEWTTSCAILSDVVGRKIDVASVANGYYSKKVGKTASQAGIRFLFNSEPTATVHTLDGCRVFGRYAVKAATRPSVSGAIAAGKVGPRWTQAALWEIRKAAKSLGGDSYLRIREFIHSGTAE